MRSKIDIMLEINNIKKFLEYIKTHQSNNAVNIQDYTYLSNFLKYLITRNDIKLQHEFILNDSASKQNFKNPIESQTINNIDEQLLYIDIFNGVTKSPDFKFPIFDAIEALKGIMDTSRNHYKLSMIGNLEKRAELIESHIKNGINYSYLDKIEDDKKYDSIHHLHVAYAKKLEEELLYADTHAYYMNMSDFEKNEFEEKYNMYMINKNREKSSTK